MNIKREELEHLPHLYKVNLVNSITGYKSANLIATKSVKGNTNVAVFSSVVHYGSSPPILGFVLRPTTVVRNTYNNIKATNYFSVNAVAESMIMDAHHTSAKYPAEISEFDKTNLSPIYLDNFYAPFVKESPIKIGLKFLEEVPIKYNGTILILGEIVTLHFKDSMLMEDGFLDLSKEKITTINGLDGYVVTTNLKRFTYQRPK
jgi:flavin reductase (DIM6/NTAB) family NADH-FMN oxidoreductase RutF